MPRKPTREEVAKIAANYKELRQKVGRAGSLVLQMLAHPDARPFWSHGCKPFRRMR